LEDHIGGLVERLDAEMKVHQTGKLAEDEQTLVGRMAQFSARHNHDAGQPRKFLTLADVRKQYQQELDRIVAIQNNQFGFTAEDDFMELVA
jgi:nuclear pore complex protein Nup160